MIDPEINWREWLYPSQFNQLKNFYVTHEKFAKPVLFKSN